MYDASGQVYECDRCMLDNKDGSMINQGVCMLNQGERMMNQDGDTIKRI